MTRKKFMFASIWSRFFFSCKRKFTKRGRTHVKLKRFMHIKLLMNWLEMDSPFDVIYLFDCLFVFAWFAENAWILCVSALFRSILKRFFFFYNEKYPMFLWLYWRKTKSFFDHYFFHCEFFNYSGISDATGIFHWM